MIIPSSSFVDQLRSWDLELVLHLLHWNTVTLYLVKAYGWPFF